MMDLIFWGILITTAFIVFAIQQVIKKSKFWRSVKVGDVLIRSDLRGNPVREEVLAKTDDAICMSGSGWMSSSHFLYHLDYYTIDDWKATL